MSSLNAVISALRVLRADIDRQAAWRLGATALLLVAAGALAALAPLALKGMVDAATGAHDLHDRTDSHRATLFATGYLAALVVGRLLAELRPTLIGVAEQHLYARLRRRYFEHLLNLPLEFHLERQTGSLVQALHQAIAGYQILIFSLVNSVVPVLVELITVACVLASLAQPALTATFAGAALAYLVMLRLAGSEIGDSAREISEASIDAHGMLADGLLNVETIKCFNAEASTRSRFERATALLESRWTRFQRARLQLGLLLAATFALAMLAVLAVALHAVMQGTLSVGGFVLANVYLLQVVRPLELLGSATRDISQAVEFVGPLRHVLEQSAQPCNAVARTSVPSSGGESESLTIDTQREALMEDCEDIAGLSFHDVHFNYGGKPVLSGLSLDIAQGRAVALVGASGSGKSSLIRLLMRLYEPRAGSIRLGKVDIGTMPLATLRALIAVVPQDTVLFNETVAFNIGIAKANATRQEIERAARLAEAHAFISALPAGYETVVGERGLKLSGGERQRIAIARAILKGPRVFVFDEATSMLDSLTERAVLRNLREACGRCTTLTIAHQLSTIQHADEIVVLHGGQVVERGSHATLVATKRHYARMWHAQSPAER